MKKTMIAAAFAATAALGLSGCTDSSYYSKASLPEGMCAAVVGNGNQHGGNRTVNQVGYPGTVVEYNSTYDMIRYFPCGPRNYRIAANSEDKGGTQLLVGRTEDGTPVNLSVTAYWQPNLSEEGIMTFLTLCQKYDCWQNDLGVGSANSSSPGWQNMLFENMRPTLERVADRALPSVTDTVWSANNPDERRDLGNEMSDLFTAQLQAVTGSVQDVFCGSTDVQTGADTGKTYDCQPVRVVVDGVWAQDGGRQAQVDQAAQRQQEIDLRNNEAQARIDLTNRLYGEFADEYRVCRDLEAQCQMVISPGEVKVTTNK